VRTLSAARLSFEPPAAPRSADGLDPRRWEAPKAQPPWGLGRFDLRL